MSTEEDGKKEELRKKIEYQVACEERAFRIVERLIENPIAEQMFLNCLQFITPNHYNDIIEERAIVKLCGYPICGKQLLNIPKQKFTISTKTNKVYNIEARKNFCSGMCYKASLYLEKQISTAPLWSRKNQPPIKFELLQLDSNSGCLGEEVILNTGDHVKADVVKIDKIDKYQEALKERESVHKAAGPDVNVLDRDTKSKDNGDARVYKAGGSDLNVLHRDTKGKDNGDAQVCELAGPNVNVLDRDTRGKDNGDAQVYTLVRALDEMKMGIDNDKDLDMNSAEHTIIDHNEKITKARPQMHLQNQDSMGFNEVENSGLTNLSCASETRILASEDIECSEHKGTESLSVPYDKSHASYRIPKVIDVESENNMSISINKEKKTNAGTAPKKTKTGLDQGQSNTAYLMRLLDKRKSLLSKMADIQPLSVTCQKNLSEDTVPTKTYSSKESGYMFDSKNAKDFDPSMHSSSSVMPEQMRVSCNNNELKYSQIGTHNATHTEIDEKRKVLVTEINNSSNSEVREIANIDHVDNNDDDNVTQKMPTPSDAMLMSQRKKKSSHPDIKGKTISTLELICRNIQAWMTVDSLDYLKTSEPEEPSHVKSEFEKQFKALEAKIDKQKGAFDDLIGEEDMSSEEPEEKSSAPLPHFDVLRQEVEDDTMKVQEFLKGSFTYKVQERKNIKDDTQGIILPSVDKYDQMLIRQRIVLDRISKVLPDLLTPLHLLFHHIFTDIRKLVCTFNLTKDNILFKPAEWILVSIVLLKLISQRNTSVRNGFGTSEAERYFSIVLKGANSSVKELDKLSMQLLNYKVDRE